MKKIAALLMSFVLLTGCVAALAEEAFTSETVPLYICSIQNKETIPLYYKDGQTDIPYIDMNTARDLLMLTFQALVGDENYDLTLTLEDESATFMRENGSMAEIDFAEGIVGWDDYDLFIAKSYAIQPLDQLSHTGFNEKGEPELFWRDPASFMRKGESVGIRFDDFFIDLVYRDGMGYMPLQTFSDLFVANTMVNLGYNGEAVFMIPVNELGDMREAYYAVEPRERSPELAVFNYVEMCLSLQFNYGLKEKHEIPSFGSLFERTGMDVALQSLDPLEADVALCNAIHGYMDDMHSKFQAASPYAGDVAVEPTLTPFSRERLIEHELELTAAAMKAYPDGRPAYEEIGNTAFITFDHFASGTDCDYYSDPGSEAMAEDDVIGLIMYAHKQINREGSPIENVVLDLSLNKGGEVDSAIYTIAWFLGKGDVHVADAMTGARASMRYRVDVNGDRVFDESDSIAHLNRYCLVSPVSFSCGNLVPASMKASNNVTLLGRHTAGGACAVQPLITADGTLWRISSRLRLSTVFNGSYSDVDAGVEPDVVLDKDASYYDREKLVALINGMN